MKGKAYKLYRTIAFIKWFNQQTEKARVQIDQRLSKIEYEGYFGEHKSVSNNDEIGELKWKNGRRIYFACFPEHKILLLLGGNKNGQQKDISKAKSLYKNHIT